MIEVFVFSIGDSLHNFENLTLTKEESKEIATAFLLLINSLTHHFQHGFLSFILYIGDSLHNLDFYDDNEFSDGSNKKIAQAFLLLRSSPRLECYFQISGFNLFNFININLFNDVINKEYDTEIEKLKAGLMLIILDFYNSDNELRESEESKHTFDNCEELNNSFGFIHDKTFRKIK